MRRAQEWTAALSRWCEAQPRTGALPRPVPGAPCRAHAAARGVVGRRDRGPARLRPARPAHRPAASWVRRTTCGPSSTGCGVSSPKRRRRTGRPIDGDGSQNPAWRSCGSRRVASTKPSPPCAASWTRPRTPVDAVEAARPPTSRSCSPVVTSPPHAQPSTSCRASRPRGTRRCCAHCPCTRPARSSLAEGDARAALAALRRAVAGWCELEAPYEAARARVLIGLACRSLGRRRGAQMELDAARSVFRELVAAPDLGRGRGSCRRTRRTGPRAG